MVGSNTSSKLLNDVKQLIEQKASKRQSELVKQFAEIIYSSVAEDEFIERTPEQIFNSIYSLWQFIQDFDGTCKLRVHNPTSDKNGWRNKHTIIELNHADMPFLVDSIRMELNRHGIDVHLHIHVPIQVARDKNGKVKSVNLCVDDECEKNKNIETPMYIEIDKQLDEDTIKQIEADLLRILGDVRATVRDWHPMRDKLASIINELESTPPPLRKDRIEEALDFLRWVKANHFVFMGSLTYDLKKSKDDLLLKPVKGSGLGTLAEPAKQKAYSLSESPKGAQKLALSNEHILVLTKTSTVSSVHRPSHIDYIGVKRFNKDGEVIGEYRFFGLFTSAAYNMDPQFIPVLRKKIHNVLAESGLKQGGHDYKALKNILETYPRDELFQIPTLKLLNVAMGILHIQERRQVRAFVRRDPFGRYFSVLCFVPRDTYNTKVRLRMTEILSETFGSKGEIEFNTHFSESNLVRTHFRVPVENAEAIDYDLTKLQADLQEAALSWEDVLVDTIAHLYEPTEATKLQKKYANAFSPGYQNQQSVLSAIADIKHIERLSEERPFDMLLYKKQIEGGLLRFKLFNREQPIPLSEVLPLLENMGLIVIDETPYKISSEALGTMWIMDFSVRYDNDIDVDSIRDKFQEAFAKAWTNQAEKDGFNRLIIATGLDWRQVAMLRAYAKYMWQIGFTFSQTYIEQTLSQYSEIAHGLVELFEHRFNPQQEFNERKYNTLKRDLKKKFEQVSNLDQDKIVNKYLEVIDATLRTNFYQQAEDGKDKSYI